jgi:hypothetical protein
VRIVAKKRHNEDKKLHNSEEKLHNSDISNEGPDLTWQEAVDLLPEDEVDAGSEIYYFTDEDGYIHSREFLAQELIDDDARDLEDSLKRKSSHVEIQRLKPGTMDIINLVPAPEEMQREISLPMPKSGARPLDIRISSEVAHDLPNKEVSRQPSDVGGGDKHVIVHLQSPADEPINTAQNRDAPSLKLSFTHNALDDYVAYRSEGIAKKSKDWINRASRALWESTRGEISHQTMTSLRTFVLSKYSSVDAHRKVLGFAAAFLKYLAQVRVDPRFLSFTLYLERPPRKSGRPLPSELSLVRTLLVCLSESMPARRRGRSVLRGRVIIEPSLFLPHIQGYDQAQCSA